VAQVTWSESAKGELRQIYEYISAHSEKYAWRMVVRIVDKTGILSEFPRIGRVVPELDDENLRELVEGSYRIIYEVVDNSWVNILRIHHSARLLNEEA